MSLRYITQARFFVQARFIIRLVEAFLKRFKSIIIIGIVTGIIIFLVLSWLLPNFDRVNKRVGFVGHFTTDNIPDEISSKLSYGLTTVDASGNVNPGIASSWESADGGKTWIFYINKDVLWQNGENVKAQDINYEFSDASIEVIDDKAIKFNLNSQFSAFPVIVSKPLFKKGLVGVGDWSVKNINLSGGYLQKLEIVNSTKDKITYKFYPSEDRLRLAFKLGEIDILNKIQDPAPFNTWRNVVLENEIGYNNFVAIFFNTEDEKLSDKAVRQALAYAIEKENFEGVRSLGPISPNSWGYNSQLKQYVMDVEKAKDINGTKIVLSTLPNLLNVAEKIKKNWNDVGILSEIQVVTAVPENYQAFLATVDIPKDPDQYSLWHSTQITTNISKFKNPRIDKLLEDGRTELDRAKRTKIYFDFQRFLVEDVPAVFLYHPVLYTITRK